MLDWQAEAILNVMQMPDTSKHGTARKKFPTWLKVLLISFFVSFGVGYWFGVHELEKDSGRLGVPHWYENYRECVDYCVFDGALFAVPCTFFAIGVWGLRNLVRKRR